MATVAKALQNLPPEERTKWGIEVKEKGNALYARKEFKEAIEVYMESLAASNFDTNNNSVSNNVDSLVVPVLCNLAACCIHMEDWNKALEFCNQVNIHTASVSLLFTIIINGH